MSSSSSSNASGGTASSSSRTTNSSSNNSHLNTTTVPFRSATKLLHVPLDTWPASTIQFVQDEHYDNDDKAPLEEQRLPQAVTLQPSDGNLSQELQVLEETIDELLSVDDDHRRRQQRNEAQCNRRRDHDPQHRPPPPNRNTSNGDIAAAPDEEHVYEQVVQDAYRLTTSSLSSIPWFVRYRQALDASTNYLTPEQFHCPVVIVFVATTMEHYHNDDGNTTMTNAGAGSSSSNSSSSHHTDDIVATLRALQSNYHYWPAQYRNGMFDPTPVRREVLILHDNVAYHHQQQQRHHHPTTTELDETALRTQIKVCFGATASILRINSLAPETAQQLAREEQSDWWGQRGQVGHLLTVGDRARIRKYIAHLVQNAVLPALERRVADLNSVVNDRKKGVKNVLKNLWGGNTRTKPGSGESTTTTSDQHHSHNNHPTNDTTHGNHGNHNTTGSNSHRKESKSTDVIYRYDSIESQTRLLGDTLFLLRDYDTALSMYRLIKDDYKQDRNWIYYGSVQEAMALCMYMIDPYGRTREIFSCVENALLSYSRAAEEDASSQPQPPGGRLVVAPVATRLATRLCLVLLAAQNICLGRHLEVADLLASASSHETALGAAVLLEQSSVHYFKAEMYRKYAFHMLMSGHMFRTAEQDHHAFRCFTSALYIYRHAQWDELHNHVRSALAAQLFAMGRMSIALQLYAKLLGTTTGGRVSVKSQQKFVQNFLEICHDHRKKALSGADRMAAPPHLSGAERDAVRTERLDRIVQVIRYTKSASRVLEIPNMNLPFIDDSTVVVIAEEAAHYRQESVPSFGEAQVGATSVWDDLMLTMNAELKAEKSNANVRMSKSLLKIEDPALRRVIALMEEEKSNRIKLERTKRSATYSQKTPVRAVKEPIAIEFAIRNPLGIPVDIRDMQLVARMTTGNENRVCTNEDAVSLQPLAASNVPKKWTFQSSDVVFVIPDFCRVSTGRNEETNIDTWKSAEDVEPFFVVTKTNVSIPPQTKQVATMSICPLVRGNLEIVGVRCRLFDSVWVFHPFDIKGPLLQNTRANRANRVRGESLLLKSNVERGMPCLSVELVKMKAPSTKDNGPALQDQVDDWILRIANVGTAPGCQLTLKTNLPWIVASDYIQSTSSQVDSEEKATTFNTGPTGTLMTIPITAASLQKNGVIQPGETISVPIKMKTSGCGKTDFYMLFRYELHDDISQGEKPRCRWLKKMFCVPIYPALGMTAAATATFISPQEHILSLEFTNCRSERPDHLDMTVNTCSVASRHYEIEPIVVTNSNMSLGWQERATMHFRLKNKGMDNEKSLLSFYPLSPSKDNNSTVPQFPVLNFLALERAHDAFEEAMRDYQMALARAAAQGDDESQPLSIAAIRRANTAGSSFMSVNSTDNLGNEHDYHPASVERLCPSNGTPDTVHVICTWHAHDFTIYGQNHIRGLLVRPLTSSNDSCPITVSCTHPSNVAHDFTIGPAIVPIQVVFCNTLISSTVVCEMIMDPNAAFDISGPGQYRMKFHGGENISIPYQVLISNAGVYNVQNVQLKVLSVENDNHNINTESTLYKFQHQWMVSVDSI